MPERGVNFGDEIGMERFVVPAGIYTEIPVHVIRRYPATDKCPEMVERYVNLDYVKLICEAFEQNRKAE